MDHESHRELGTHNLSVFATAMLRDQHEGNMSGTCCHKLLAEFCDLNDLGTQMKALLCLSGTILGLKLQNNSCLLVQLNLKEVRSCFIFKK